MYSQLKWYIVISAEFGGSSAGTPLNSISPGNHSNATIPFPVPISICWYILTSHFHIWALSVPLYMPHLNLSLIYYWMYRSWVVE